MARKRFHGLKRVKFRASWNKYNLFNLTRLRMPQTRSQTYYQQKWSSKSITRAYHGEQIREKQWQRMFTPRLDAVVPMDHRYLADHDGSELAAGRGSGRAKELIPGSVERSKKPIPYMHMTYAPIERRLDMAIFRALFASSARQARQFVVHGKVKVNGQKMPYPGYLLNPGDMFSVDIESVLFATGAPKDPTLKRRGRILRRTRRKVNVSMEKLRTEASARKAAQAEKQAEEQAAEDAEDAEDLPKTSTLSKTALTDNFEIRKSSQETLTSMINYMQLMTSSKRSVRQTAKLKQVIRAWSRKARVFVGQTSRKPIADLEKERRLLVGEYYQLFRRVKESNWKKNKGGQGESAKSKSTQGIESSGEQLSVDGVKVGATWAERTRKKGIGKVTEMIVRAVREQVDPTKPYATPWRPRDYMSAFAFIPRYLEVNHKICSAVYLRHPVARPGLTEVPSPFPQDIQQLAFNWYLRRR